MIEAELKAVVRDPEHVMAELDKRATGCPEVYQDTYYDDPAGTGALVWPWADGRTDFLDRDDAVLTQLRKRIKV